MGCWFDKFPLNIFLLAGFLTQNYDEDIVNIFNKHKSHKCSCGKKFNKLT